MREVKVRQDEEEQGEGEEGVVERDERGNEIQAVPGNKIQVFNSQTGQKYI